VSGVPDLGVSGAAAADAGADPSQEGPVRRAGFAALITGRGPTLPELAAVAGVSEDTARAVVAALVAAGRATTTPEGRLDGIAGITTRPTRHAIEWSGGRLQTWCAFDAVGIPAAFGWTATALTTCGGCGTELRVQLDDGVPRGEAWGWLPPGDCEHILRDFCAAADLYCHRAHLDEWRTATGDPPGEPHPVADLADLGRTAWADCLPPGCH
jgi:alkylmercury lyase